MKGYLHIFTLSVLCALASCVKIDIDYDSTVVNPSSEGEIHIFGAVEDYDVKYVGTRAGGEEISDAFISEMTMFIFKANGEIIPGYRTRNATFDADGNLIAANFDNCEECSSALNIAKANPTFLVDTEDGIIASYEGEKQTLIYFDNFADDLQGCQIYIVANAYHQLKDELNEITTLDKLKSFVLDIDNTLAMPKDGEGNYRGFPMIGTPQTAKFNLKKGDKNEHSVANIPLKKLYSKVRFTLQVCANQVVSGQIPTFTITKAEVFNVPTKVRLGRDLNAVSGQPIYGENSNDDYVNEIAGGSISSDNIGNYYQFTGSEPFVITTFNKTTTTHNPSVDQTDDRIEFGFYMPEHKVTPNTITYPAGMPENCRQYYKPKGVGATRDESGLVTLAKIATYVRIHGQYTDHNGQIKDVRYDIYLGQNEVDDFTVKRNQQLNNQLVITGLTNYYNAYEDTQDNISIDHRVAVEYKGFNLSMERTAILDSHFEVRPLDVELSPGSTMVITIPNDCRTWVGMESDAAVRANYSAQTYISNVKGKAVRKYFTTGLVGELNGTNGGTITLAHSGKENKTETYRIWFYIDENPNVYDKLLGESDDKGGITSSPSDGSYSVYGKNDTNPMYRVCPVEFNYYGTDNDNTGGGVGTVTKTVNVNLQQWNLWRVWGGISGNRYYDIEHEEEYLNNYVSDEIYGQTQDGMAWGLEGIQLSNNVMAYWAEKKEHDTGSGLGANILEFIVGIMDSYLNFSSSSAELFSKSCKEPYFDFYLSRDNFPINKLDSGVDKTKYARDYNGLGFNKEIATTLKALGDSKGKIDGIILTEDPQSAIAYCYNKNKRNSNGVVETQKWFLPAIDEIEDIALGAYEEFDRVFQNQKYWSCQPAYESNSVIINPIYYTWVLFGSTYIDYSKYITMEGQFYNECLSRARSTSVFTADGISYQNINSGIPNNLSSGKLNVTTYIEGNRDGETITSWTPSNIDYSNSIFTNPYGEYRGNSARTEVCRIRAVYRSGQDTSKPAK